MGSNANRDRSEDWDLVHQTLAANRSGAMFDVCERLSPCSSVNTTSCILIIETCRLCRVLTCDSKNLRNLLDDKEGKTL